MRKLNTNKTQILRRICLRKKNSEKFLGGNCQEAQLQIDDIIIILQDKLYTLAWEAEFGGQLFDFFLLYTEPNAREIDESHTQGPDTGIVPRSFFLTQVMVKWGKLSQLLTHLRYIIQFLNRIVKVKTLKPPQTYVIVIVQKKHLIQTWKLKLHKDIFNSQLWGTLNRL